MKIVVEGGGVGEQEIDVPDARPSPTGLVAIADLRRRVGSLDAQSPNARLLLRVSAEDVALLNVALEELERRARQRQEMRDILRGRR